MKLTTDEQMKENDRLNSGLFRIYLLSFCVAFIVLGLISYGFYTSNQINRTYGPLIDAAMEIELEATKAHLWFEEVLSGDRHEDLKTGWQHLRRADWYARVMIEGGENEHGKFTSIDNDELKEDVARVRNKLESFRNIMKKRIEKWNSSSAGSDIDQHFDETYGDLLEETGVVEAKLKRIMKEEFGHQQLSQKVLLGICMLSFMVLGVIHLRFNRHQTIILEALQKAKEKLEEEMDDRKEAEEEIQIQNEEMQKRLLEIAELRDMDEERLADLNLANEQLRISIDEADAEERDKSEFFAGMTHEIRTPTNAIIDLTYLTLDTPLVDDQRDKINTIKESSYSILSLLDSYMDILEIEYGNLEIKKTEFNIQNMLDSIIMTLSPQAHKKGVELLCDIDSNVISDIMGDKGRLWQILIHLVGNAIKFTVDGKIELRVNRVYFGSGSDHDKSSSDPPQILLHFSVCDTGIGIPDERLTDIFEHYSTSETPNIREFGETRLGLHVSNKLVHMMGGEIWAESKEGEGSSFHFTTMFVLASGPEKHEPLSDAAIDESGPSACTGVEFNDPGELPTT
jgi:signal transduction histidine kinase